MRWCKLCQSPTPGSRLLQKSPRQVLPEHPSSHFPPPAKKTLQPILAFRIHLFSTTTSPVFSYDYLAFFPSLLHALHRSTQQPPPPKKKAWSPGKRNKTGWKYLCANTFVQIAFFSNRQMACSAKGFYFYGTKRYPWNVFLNLEFLNLNQPHIRIYWEFCQTVLLLSYLLCK